MNEITALIYAYGRAVWRRRWWAVATAWIVALGAWAVILRLPDRYEASATVFVDARTPLQPVLEGIAIQEDYKTQLSLVREALLSRPQLQAVARQTNLDVDVKTPSDMDHLVTDLKWQIRVTVAVPLVQQEDDRPQDSIYTISYQNPDRDKSIEVVRTLLHNFMENTLSGHRSGSTEAQTFLNKQIEDLERRLQEAEARLAEFKTRNVGMMPGGTHGDYFSRLGSELAGEQQTASSLALLKSRRSELQRQLGVVRARVLSTVSAGTGGTAGAALDSTLRRQAAEAKLAELQLQYTDKWPDVIAQKQTIQDLKRLEAAELAVLNDGGGADAVRPLTLNPEYLAIQGQLNSVEVEIASSEGVLAQHRGEISRLRQMTNQGPEVDQEFARLDRDYGMTKRLYEDMVARREQSRVSDEAARTGIIRFDELEPPRAAFEPAWPNRKLFFIEALAVAMVLGVAVALLPYMIVPTFDDVSLLERKFGLPVLGAVSALRSSMQRGAALRQIRHVGIAAAMLITTAGILVVVGDRGARFLNSLLP